MPKNTPGKWRTCGDYRCINAITKPDRYPIPNLQSITAKINGKKVFLKQDLLKAYHQIPAKEEDIKKNCCHFSVWPVWVSIYVFWIKKFKLYISEIYGQFILKCWLCICIPGLIFSETPEQHLKNLEAVLKILHDNNLRLSLDKYLFLQTSLDYLGFHIGPDSISPTEKTSKD